MTNVILVKPSRFLRGVLGMSSQGRDIYPSKAEKSVTHFTEPSEKMDLSLMAKIPSRLSHAFSEDAASAGCGVFTHSSWDQDCQGVN